MCINIIPTAPWSPWGTRSSRTFTVFGAGPVDGLSKPEQRTCLPQGNEERGHLSRRPEAWNSETSTAQYIIYNTYNRAVWNPRRLRKRLGSRALELLFPSPDPPKKKTNNPPENASPSTSHHQCAPGIDPIGKPPSANPVHRTHAQDSHPKPASDRALTPSRTRISSPLAIAREQRRARSNTLPRRNATATCARAMGQDYPSTGPSPGANPPIYPSSLPLACGNLLSNIFPKSHGFFSFNLMKKLIIILQKSKEKE